MKKKLEPIGIGTVCIIALVAWCWIIGSSFKEVKSEVVPTVIITKPATPKAVVHQWFANADQMNYFVGKCVREGYVIKVAQFNHYGRYGWFHGYVIAEKY